MKPRQLSILLSILAAWLAEPVASRAATGWSTQIAPNSASLRAVALFDPNTAWAVGDHGTIAATTDAGASWFVQSTDVIVGLRGVAFVDATTGIAVGESGTILRTTDGGSHWATIRTDWLDVLNDVVLNGDGSAIAVGQNPILQPFVGKSTDFGLTWSFSSFYVDGNEGTLTGVTMRNPSMLWASATLWDGRGAVVSTTNAGTTWSTETTTPQGLNAIHTAFPGVITAVGEGGAGLRYQGSWTPLSIAPGVSLRDVAQIGASRTSVVGSSGRIYRTTDSGSTWVLQSSGTLRPLEAVDFYIGGDVGVAVGEVGTILWTTTGGWPTTAIDPALATREAEAISVAPNPILETAHLRLDLRAGGRARLRILDVSGRECLARSLGMLEPGEVVLHLDGAELPTHVGMYFVRVDVDEGERLAGRFLRVAR